MATLEEMLAAAARDSARRPEFYRALLASDLFVVGTVAGDKLSFQTLPTDTGPVVPIFTSPERVLDGYPAGTPYVGMNAKALLASLADGTRAVLNPFSSSGKELTPEEIAWLRKGAPARFEEVEIPAGATILVGAPAKRPEGRVRGHRRGPRVRRRRDRAVHALSRHRVLPARASVAPRAGEADPRSLRAEALTLRESRPASSHRSDSARGRRACSNLKSALEFLR